jgi:hypothetical protein
MWIVPAPVAGTWRGKFLTDSGEGELTLTLHQRLSDISGSFEFRGATNLLGSVTADLWGTHLRCWCVPTNTLWHPHQMWVDGQIQSNTFSGSLRRVQGVNTIETPWTARREPVDFVGAWEWSGAKNAPVQLHIERRHGRLAMIYTDKNREKTPWRDDTRPIEIFDTYDFGGGFYFTLLLGLEGNSYRAASRRLGPDDGWLVGEAIMENGQLKGTLGFYPYSQSRISDFPPHKPSEQHEPKLASPSGPRDWQPKRVSP